MAFKPNIPELTRQVRIVIYGDGGCGKTTAALSLLKNPKLKLVFFAMEATTLPAIERCFDIYEIEDLLPGQLTLVVPETAKPKDAEAIKGKTDGTFFNNVASALSGKGKATDIKTGEKITLKSFTEYDEDTVLIFDGVSAVVAAVANLANLESVVKNDARGVYKFGADTLINLFSFLTRGTKAHLVVLGHYQLTEADGQTKYKLPAIHPYFYVRSAITQICGMFTWVVYASRNTQNGSYKLSISEPQVYTRDAIDRVAFKKLADELNKTRKPHEKIDLNNMPTDLTSPVWPFMKQCTALAVQINQPTEKKHVKIPSLSEALSP